MILNLYHLDPNNAIDALADTDNDGILNINEYMNNTNPVQKDYYQIYGEVTHLGINTGQVHILAYKVSDISFETPIAEQIHECYEDVGPIHFSLIVPNGHYVLRAFNDINHNMRQDQNEASSQYSQTSIISNQDDEISRNIKLESGQRIHGDLDGNGIVDINDVKGAFNIYMGENIADISLLNILKCNGAKNMDEVTIEDVKCVFMDYLGL